MTNASGKGRHGEHEGVARLEVGAERRLGCHVREERAVGRPTEICMPWLRRCIDVGDVTAYRGGMRKHTTIDLDIDLVRQAAEALGTARTTDTIHAALSEVVGRRLRMEILGLRPALSLDDLGAMRAHRFAEDGAPYGSDIGDG